MSNYKQYTVLADAKSDILDITCGFPDGSILGPLLALLILMTYKIVRLMSNSNYLQMTQIFYLLVKSFSETSTISTVYLVT